MLKAKQINSRATSNAFPLGFEKKVEFQGSSQFHIHGYG